jgi:hypothetical protein
MDRIRDRRTDTKKRLTAHRLLFFASIGGCQKKQKKKPRMNANGRQFFYPQISQVSADGSFFSSADALPFSFNSRRFAVFIFYFPVFGRFGRWRPY